MKSILLVFLFISFHLDAQKLNLVSSVDFDATNFIGIDSYKNVYSIKDMVIHKQGPNGNFIFNDFQLGRISSVDIINPLDIIVFYDDTNTVVFLDNKLSEIERVTFNNLGEFINVSTATNAGNNKLWIFNVNTQQLELYNYRENRRTTVSQPFPGKPISQSSNFNYCTILTENKLRTFNVYGSLISESDADQFLKIVIHENSLLVLKENELLYISEDNVMSLNIPISENTIKDLYLSKDFMYIYDGKKLHTFSIIQLKQ